MDNLENQISLFAAVISFISIIAVIISNIRNFIIQRKSLIEPKNKQLETILDSSDIISLGRYLDNDIGELFISDYVDNKELTKKLIL